MDLQPCRILSPAGLTQEINNHHNKLLVFCFLSNSNQSSYNCEQIIMNDFGKGLVTQYENKVVFFYIDVDMNRIIAQQFGITHTPQFIINQVINKQLIKLSSVVGPQMSKLSNEIDKHLGIPHQIVQAHPPIIVQSQNHYQQLLNQFTQGEIVVLMFTASWCGPCKRIKQEVYDPITGEGMLKELEKLAPNKIKFLILDVDDLDELSSQFKIKSVPTIYLLQYQKYFDVGKYVEKHKILSKISSGKSKDVSGEIQKLLH